MTEPAEIILFLVLSPFIFIFLWMASDAIGEWLSNRKD